MIDMVRGWLISFLQNHDWGVVVLSVVVFCRTVFKPIMTVIEGGVKASGSPTAAADLEKVESSKLYKAISFAIDYVTSIKIDLLKK